MTAAGYGIGAMCDCGPAGDVIATNWDEARGGLFSIRSIICDTRLDRFWKIRYQFQWGVHYRNLGDYVSYRDLSRKGTLTTLEISERGKSSSIQSLDKVISDWGQIKSGLG